MICCKQVGMVAAVTCGPSG